MSSANRSDAASYFWRMWVWCSRSCKWILREGRVLP